MTAQFEKHPFLLPSADVAAALKTDIDNGLTSAQVAKLQNAYPSNELDIQGSISWHSILAKQLFNAMILGKCTRTCVQEPASRCLCEHWGLLSYSRSPRFRYHRLLCHQRLDRRRCACCSHRTQCVYWVCARIQGRKEDGLSSSLKLAFGKRSS